MTPLEIRDTALLLSVFAIVVVAAISLVRSRVPGAPPSGVANRMQHIDNEFSTIRHRINNVEQQTTILPDLLHRVRDVEHKTASIQSDLRAIRDSAVRNERMLEMLVKHQLETESSVK